MYPSVLRTLASIDYRKDQRLVVGFDLGFDDASCCSDFLSHSGEAVIRVDALERLQRVGLSRQNSAVPERVPTVTITPSAAPSPSQVNSFTSSVFEEGTPPHSSMNLF